MGLNPLLLTQALIHDSHPPTEARNHNQRVILALQPLPTSWEWHLATKVGFSPCYQASSIMPVNIYGHDLKSIAVDGAACGFALKDATGGVRTIFDGGPTIDVPNSFFTSQKVATCKFPHLCLLQKNNFNRARALLQGDVKGILMSTLPFSSTPIKGRRHQHERVVLRQYEELMHGPYRSPQLQLCLFRLRLWLWRWFQIATLCCLTHMLSGIGS